MSKELSDLFKSSEISTQNFNNIKITQQVLKKLNLGHLVKLKTETINYRTFRPEKDGLFVQEFSTYKRL